LSTACCQRLALAFKPTAHTLRAVPIDLSNFDAVLLDLDGTVYHEEHALPGAVELIHRLQRQGKPYACLTNSTSSPQRIVARLARMGVGVDAEHVYTAAAAATDYVLERFGQTSPPHVFNCSTEGVHEMLDGRVQWVLGEHETCDAVICGVPLNVFATADRLRTAMLLLRKGASLVAICADRVYPSPRGMEFGVGAMAAMLAYASGATPIDCGKPQPLFFQELCRRLHVEPRRCVLIGDNLESDIAGGKSVGMTTVLTLGGVSSRQDVELLAPERRPDWIINDLREV
jgi:HAD superfamily hydrolase (TIGR01450 family)